MASILEPRLEKDTRLPERFDLGIPVGRVEGPLIRSGGKLMGAAVHGIRLSGEGERMNSDRIRTAVRSRNPGPEWISIFGLDPILWDLFHWMKRLPEYRIEVVTDGVIHRDWLALADLVTITPWLPSSRTVWSWDRLRETLQRLPEGTVDRAFHLRIVEAEDLEFAAELASRHRSIPIYLQPATAGETDYGCLAREVLNRKDLHHAVVQPEVTL